MCYTIWKCFKNISFCCYMFYDVKSFFQIVRTPIIRMSALGSRLYIVVYLSIHIFAFLDTHFKDTFCVFINMNYMLYMFIHFVFISHVYIHFTCLCKCLCRFAYIFIYMCFVHVYMFVYIVIYIFSIYKKVCTHFYKFICICIWRSLQYHSKTYQCHIKAY